MQPTIPPSANWHVIGDQKPKYKKKKPIPGQYQPTGGHVLTQDMVPGHGGGTNSHGLPYGLGVGGQPPPNTVFNHNGTYEYPNAPIEYPGGNTLQKPFSTMYPPGVPSTHDADVAQQAAHNGTFNNGKWSGTGIVPRYDRPLQPRYDPMPNYTGKPINIEGYYNQTSGEVATHYPGGTQ